MMKKYFQKPLLANPAFTRPAFGGRVSGAVLAKFGYNQTNESCKNGGRVMLPLGSDGRVAMSSGSKYKAVIFDLFGTLVGTFSSREHDKVLDDMARVLGVEDASFVRIFDYDMRAAREKGEYSTIEENIEVVCNQLGVKPKLSDIQQAAVYRYEFMKKALLPRDDAIQTLNQIKAKGLVVGLISDCSPDVPDLWGSTPFAKCIDVPVFSCDVGMKKPERRIYQLVCERLGVEPQECLYVGDGDSLELEGALRMGMEPILIRVEGEDEQDRDRPSVNTWKGKRISALQEVLKHV